MPISFLFLKNKITIVLNIAGHDNKQAKVLSLILLQHIGALCKNYTSLDAFQFPCTFCFPALVSLG